MPVPNIHLFTGTTRK